MRYITIVALAFAFAGSAHGARAEAKYRMNWRGGKDSPVFERADCRPTAITRKMLNAVRKDHCWDAPKKPAWERPECRAAVEALSNILEKELKTK